MLTHPKQPKQTTTSAKPKFSGPEPGFGLDVVSQTWVWARCGHFWLFWERLKPKVCSCKRPPKQPTKTTSGPNPRFRAQNLGLGQMWSFWVVMRRVYTKNFHIWPKPRFSGPEPGFWARCGHLGLFCKGGLSLAFGFCLWGVSLAICVLLMSG